MKHSAVQYSMLAITVISEDSVSQCPCCSDHVIIGQTCVSQLDQLVTFSHTLVMGFMFSVTTCPLVCVITV